MIRNDRKFHHAAWLSLFGLWGIWAAAAGEPVADVPQTPIHTEVRRVDEQWVLFRDGSPYHIKGAVYGGDAGGKFPMREIVECGGNSLRAGRNREMLDAAYRLGLSVTVGLPFRGEYIHGFNYDDEVAVKKQFDEIRSIVELLKNHPAVLMWGVGNEVSLFYKNPKFLDAMNDVARRIHEIDPHHPTMTANGDNPFDRGFIQLFKEKCPHIDLLGMNSYKDVTEIPGKLLEFGWDKPYILTEWGPSGHWQVPKTRWKIPVEESSTEKADVYKKRYEEVVLKDSANCLGSYVFYWGNKQERTHTWYGMFLPTGERLETVDVMQFLWSGRWPENRAPRIERCTLDGLVGTDSISFGTSSAHEAAVRVVDPEGDPLAYEWECIPEPTEFGYGGRNEKKPASAIGPVSGESDGRFAFTAPDREGPYRLFVTVRDGRGRAAVANIPFSVLP